MRLDMRKTSDTHFAFDLMVMDEAGIPQKTIVIRANDYDEAEMKAQQMPWPRAALDGKELCRRLTSRHIRQMKCTGVGTIIIRKRGKKC